MRRCGKAIAVAGVAAITLAFGWLALAPKAPPSFAEVKAQWRPSDVELIDRNGDPLYQRAHRFTRTASRVDAAR